MLRALLSSFGIYNVFASTLRLVEEGVNMKYLVSTGKNAKSPQ
jgi:hypothetical protein